MHLPILAGGTMLYIRAVTAGYHFPSPACDADLRGRLYAQAEQEGPASLHEWLKRVDPETAARLHPGDVRRLVRALEVWRRTGLPPSHYPKRPPRFRYGKLVLWPERAWLFPRLEERARRQFERGLVAEVKALLERFPRMPTALQAIGYKEVAGYLRGEYGLEEAVERDVRAVKAYAKRQYTWFRHEPGDVTYLPKGGEGAYLGFRDWLRLHFRI